MMQTIYFLLAFVLLTNGLLGTNGDSLDDALNCLEQDMQQLDCINGNAHLEAAFECVNNLTSQHDATATELSQETAYAIVNICFQDQDENLRVKAFYDKNGYASE